MLYWLIFVVVTQNAEARIETGVDGKVVIITGAASGIGEAAVMAFADEGAISILVDRDQEKGMNLSEKLSAGGKKIYLFKPI